MAMASMYVCMCLQNQVEGDSPGFWWKFVIVLVIIQA